MIYIKKSAEPRALHDYRKQIGISFDDMDADVKTALRDSLLKEQGHLCAYCMRRINGSNDVKIEHYVARNRENELQYENLLAVCKGNEGQKYEYLICDSRKGNEPLTINPLRMTDMQTIYYTRDGRIHSTDNDMDEDLNQRLNLNCATGSLIESRKTARQSIEKHLHQYKDKKALKRRLEHLRDHYTVHTDPLPEYVGAIRYYIDKKLKQI